MFTIVLKKDNEFVELLYDHGSIIDEWLDMASSFVEHAGERKVIAKYIRRR